MCLDLQSWYIWDMYVWKNAGLFPKLYALFFQYVLSIFLNQKWEVNVHNACQKNPDIS